MNTKEISPVDQVLIDTITKVSDTTGKGLDKSIDFLSAQVPDLIQQLLTFRLIWSSVSLLLCVAGLFVLYYISKKLYKITDGAILILTGILGGSLIPASIMQIRDIIYIIAAPKIYLIEYAANLISK